MNKLIFNTVLMTLSFIIIGCGKGGGTPLNLTKGYLIDTPINGVNYKCENISGVTKNGGEFECEKAPVSFSIGGYLLGTIDHFTVDKKVYLQDLLGLPRANYTDPNLIELARLVQSLDDDGDISTEITITPEMASKFNNASNSATVEELATLAGVTLVSVNSAMEHLYRTRTNQVNHVPTANSQNISLQEDSTKSITLKATDSDGDTLRYTILSNPAHGTLSGTAPNITYIPTANFHGSDSFKFRVSDGIFNSNIATVNITITSVNDKPTATSKSVTVAEDSKDNAITLSATDVDNDTLTYSIVSNPTHGELTGSGTNRKYTPTANFHGNDSFTFKVNDGKVDSSVATITIKVTNVNDAPVISKDNLKISFKDHNITNCDSNFTQTFVIDLDDDKDIDIVTASRNDDRIAWYKNNGSELFTEHNISTTADGAFSVYAIDLDGDSIKDVLSASQEDNRIVWYKNNGSELFTEHNISTNSNNISYIFATDIDGDNGVDILSADSDDNNITWYENDSSENFTKHTVAENFNGASYAYAFDFNKDGHMDILATATKDDDKNRTAWYQNDGNENFTEHNISNDIEDEVKAIYAINLNSDTDNDIIVASSKRVIIYENNGTNTSPDFKEHNLSLPEYAPSINVMAKDIDSDGDLDIFSSGVWFENNGTVANPDWTNRHIIEKYTVAYFSMVDLDDDNDTDIVAPLYHQGALKWYENLGKNAFYINEGDINVTTISATDIDGDKLTYGVLGTDVSQFNINSSTGLLSFKTAPDYENPKDSDKDNRYEITLSVNDGNVTTKLDVKVIVDDVDGQ